MSFRVSFLLINCFPQLQPPPHFLSVFVERPFPTEVRFYLLTSISPIRVTAEPQNTAFISPHLFDTSIQHNTYTYKRSTLGIEYKGVLTPSPGA